MTTLRLSRSRPQVIESLTTAFARLERFVARHAAAYRAYQTTRAELTALSERDLADVGIPADKIDDVAREAARKLRLPS